MRCPLANRRARRHNAHLGIQDVGGSEQELGSKGSWWERSGACASPEGVYSDTTLWRVAHNLVEIKKCYLDVQGLSVFPVLGQESTQGWKARRTFKVNNSEGLGSIGQNLHCSGRESKYKMHKVAVSWFWVNTFSLPEFFCILFLHQGGSMTRPSSPSGLNGRTGLADRAKEWIHVVSPVLFRSIFFWMSSQGHLKQNH